MSNERLTGRAGGLAELVETVQHWGFWRLPPGWPDPPDLPDLCNWPSAPASTYAPTTTDLLKRVLRGLEELS